MLKVAEEESYEKTKQIEELQSKSKKQNDRNHKQIQELEMYVKELKKLGKANSKDLGRFQDLLYQQSDQLEEAMKYQ